MAPLYRILAAGSLCCIFGWADAQEERKGVTLEEVTVTAEKREASLQDAPAAVAAIQSDDLIAQGITDQSMLTRVVPGLLLGDQGGTGLFFVLQTRLGGAIDHRLGKTTRAPDAVIATPDPSRASSR